MVFREEGGLIFPYAPCAVPRPGQVAPIDSPITGYVVAYSTLELTTVGGGAGAGGVGGGAGGVGGGAGGTRERWERGEVVVAENVANPTVTLRGLRADTQYVSCAGAVWSAFKLTSRPLLSSWEWGEGAFQKPLRTQSLFVCVCVCVWAPSGLRRRYCVAVMCSNAVGVGPAGEWTEPVWTKGPPTLPMVSTPSCACCPVPLAAHGPVLYMLHCAPCPS
jgi:hypothetical protein